MTSDCEWDPSLYDNEYDDIFHDAHAISGDYPQYEIHLSDFQGPELDFNNPGTLDISNIFHYDDLNIHSCIRYAHLNAKDTLARSPMLDLYKAHKFPQGTWISRN